MNNRLFFTIFLSLHYLIISAQPSDTLPRPILWVKADSAILGAAQWHDISGNGYNLLPHSGALPDTFARLNFNRAFELENDYFTASGLPFVNRDMTAITLYQMADTAEQAIWQIPIDSNRAGLTSRQLLGTWGDISYRDSNALFTIVHTLFRNWDWKNSLPTDYRFELLKADSLPFRGKVAECLLFDWHIDDTTMVEYISYLSLKYGITLFKTDYLSSDKRMIWDYSNNPDFSYSIAGLGRDDRLGLYQKQSYMLDEKIVTGFGEIAPTNESNPAILSDGEYMIWGFDSSLLSRNGVVYLDNGEEFEVYGNGLFQRTKGREIGGWENAEQGVERTVFMTVDGSEWDGSIENYYLLIDRSGTGEFRPGEIDFYMPDYVNSNNILHFSNIQWDADSNGIDRFCFTYVPVDSILSNRSLVINGGNSGDKNGNDQKRIKNQKITDEKANAYKVYPNPSEGNFVLEADFAERSDITVKLYSPEGKIMDTKTATGQQNYRFLYQLSVSGQYLLEVSGGGETKILKIVINK
ncbi:MAG: T9SS type A sorting domain-containing protein [Bacteroidales bacterium]|jgi:hypothetical protein|nr:T9SS type A sorting domain-containing protein [Bacteroidales bacterium]